MERTRSSKFRRQMKLPKLVQAATQFEYPFPITGFLLNAELRQDGVIHGYIYNDTKRRFADGTHISTALVTYIQVELERHIAHTQSGSSYVICNYYFPSGEIKKTHNVSIEFVETDHILH